MTICPPSELPRRRRAFAPPRLACGKGSIERMPCQFLPAMASNIYCFSYVVGTSDFLSLLPRLTSSQVHLSSSPAICVKSASAFFSDVLVYTASPVPLRLQSDEFLPADRLYLGVLYPFMGWMVSYFPSSLSDPSILMQNECMLSHSSPFRLAYFSLSAVSSA